MHSNILILIVHRASNNFIKSLVRLEHLQEGLCNETLLTFNARFKKPCLVPYPFPESHQVRQSNPPIRVEFHAIAHKLLPLFWDIIPGPKNVSPIPQYLLKLRCPLQQHPHRFAETVHFRLLQRSWAFIPPD